METPPSRRWPAAYFVLCGAVFLAFTSYEWARSPLTPLYAHSLGTSEAFLGLIVGASTWTGVLLKFPAGALSDVFGRRRVLLAGMFFFAFVPLAYRFATTPWLLLAVRFVHGAATGIYSPVALAIVADFFKERRAEAMGWYTAFAQTGRSLGPVGMGYVLAATGKNYTGTYLVAAPIGIAAFLLALRMRLAPPPSGPAEPAGQRLARSFREAVSEKAVLFTAITEGVVMLSAGAVQAFLPLYAVQVRGLAEITAAWLYSAQVFTSFLARPVMGMISDRIGRKPMVVGGMVLAAGAFALMARTGSPLLLFALSAAFGLAEAVIHTSTHAYVADVCKQRSLGSALGVFGSIMDVGHAAGPMIMGALLVALHKDYATSFLIVAGAVALFAAIFGLVARPAEAKAPGEG